MVNKCVAAGCSNTPSDRITLFRFPRDPALRKEWTRQVQRTRADWKPTENSSLCSEHFTADCFEIDSSIAASFGISKRKRLTAGAIPTIFIRPVTVTVRGDRAVTTLAGKRPATVDHDRGSKKKEKCCREKRTAKGKVLLFWHWKLQHLSAM